MTAWTSRFSVLLLLPALATAVTLSFQRLDPVRSDGAVRVSGDGRVVVWTTTASVAYRQVVGQAALSARRAGPSRRRPGHRASPSRG